MGWDELKNSKDSWLIFEISVEQIGGKKRKTLGVEPALIWVIHGSMVIVCSKIDQTWGFSHHIYRWQTWQTFHRGDFHEQTMALKQQTYEYH